MGDSRTLDVTAAHMLAEVAAELEQRGIRFLMARDIGAVEDMMRLSESGQALQRVYPTVDAAVRACQNGVERGSS